jgi:hypothetical protein
MCFGTIFVATVYIRIFYAYDYQKFFPLLYGNPLAAFSSLLSDQFGGQYGGIGIIPGFNIGTPYGYKGPTPWLINVYVDLGITALSLFLAAIKINPVGRSLLSIIRGKHKVVEAIETEQAS